MLQNPAGERPPTPTDNILESIRDALAGLRNIAFPASDQIGGPTTIYVGAHMRFVSLSNGGKLEILRDSDSTWVEQARWTET